jgi:predicted DsbA family dithiol-disulfide isomerase
MDQEHYMQYAKDLGMDVKKFQDSITSKHGKPTIDADANEGKSLGVSGTPAFFINGHFLSGAQPLPNFVNVINTELTRLKIAIPAAATAAASPAPPAGG